MNEIHWLNERGLCDDGHHPYKLDNGSWRYPQGRTAIRKLIKSNGATNYEFVCTVQGCRWKSSPIPNELAEVASKTLPVLEPRRSAYAATSRCGYLGCESTEVEWHHYAPYNTFGREADNYPVLPLCRQHHRHWHETMDGYQWRRAAITPGVDCEGCGANAKKGHQCFCAADSRRAM